MRGKSGRGALAKARLISLFPLKAFDPGEPGAHLRSQRKSLHLLSMEFHYGIEALPSLRKDSAGVLDKRGLGGIHQILTAQS